MVTTYGKKNKLKIQLQIMEKINCMISHTEYEIINKKNRTHRLYAY